MYSSNTALIVPFQNVRWTYEELRHQVDKLAARLLSLGLKQGDRVGIWSPNNAEWVVTQMATAKVGLILVNINPSYRRFELTYALNKVECKALITAQVFKTSRYVDMLMELLSDDSNTSSDTFQSHTLPHLQYVIGLGEDTETLTNKVIPYSHFMESHPSPSEQKVAHDVASTIQPTDPINLQFTSGTTGSPKAATLTSLGLVNNGRIVGELMNFTDQDILCLPVPLYHCFGMVLGILASFTHGASVVLPNPDFSPKQTLQAIFEESCTALHGVPTMFLAMLEDPTFDSQLVKPTLRTGIMAGTLCPKPLMERVMMEMGMQDITICYGMTETSPVSFQTTADSPLEKRTSTVGMVHPHVEAKIVNTNGNVVPRGEIGELLTRGYLVMKGYWNDSERTARSIDEQGWMHTEDLASFDEDGYSRIEGRIKDMIIRGGENIYPREIEDFLRSMDGISDVQVFGVPDEKYGEVVCAWILLASSGRDRQIDDESVREYCHDQISHFKIPKLIRFVDEFPMTVTGKPQKYIMREQMAKELGLSSETKS
jgi:fatty-acyl-CoA synthase